MARPTKSRSLYAQMAGRSTRPLAGLVDSLDDKDARKAAIASSAKPSCLIVDFVGNSGKHKLMSAADILGGKVSDEAISVAIRKAKESGSAVRISERLDEEEDAIRDAAEERRRADEARKAKLVAKAKYSIKTINPFDIFQIAPTKERGWDEGKVLTEKQTALLLKQGINPDGMPYAQAKQVLNELFRRWKSKLATVKQVTLLQRYGYKDPNITFDQATNIINKLAAGGWRKN
jgi:type I site-specific restriction endonuclease